MLLFFDTIPILGTYKTMQRFVYNALTRTGTLNKVIKTREWTAEGIISLLIFKFTPKSLLPLQRKI